MNRILMDLPNCQTCGTQFENIFDAVWHVAADMDENMPIFEPKCVTSDGGVLLVGSLLQTIWSHAQDANEVRYIVERTYATLVAHSDYSRLARRYAFNVLLKEDMKGIDEEYKLLVSKTTENEGE